MPNNVGMLNAFSKAWSSLPWNRTALPPRYSDGWQASIPLGLNKPVVGGVSALRRGLDILEGTLSATPLLVYVRGKEAPESTAAEVIRNTPASHFAKAYADMFSNGNGFLYRNGDRFENIEASRVSAYTNDKGRPVYLLDGVTLMDMTSICHFMARNPDSPFLGNSLLSAYDESAGHVATLLGLANQLAGNSAFAEMVFSTEAALSGAQMQELKTRIDEVTSAAEGKLAGKLILSHGMSVQALRKLPSALDADIVKSLNFTTEECARITGVPLSLLSTREASASYSSSIESNRAFYRATMRPLFARVEQELSRVLRAEVRFDVQELLLGVGTERSEVVSKLVHAGVLTSNEGRAAFGYGKLATGGDVPGMPSQLTPITAWENPPAPEKQDVGI